MFRVLLLCLLIAPAMLHANNAGIVQGLWFDRQSFFAEEPVRVYVAVRNNTGADLSGTVEFFVNDDKIERKNIEALNNRVVESWADWTPAFGTSTITATLSRTEISSTASGTQAIEVVSAIAEELIFVDRDTDGDGIGNQTDNDDDNDGQSDHEEIEAGTDPLVFDEPEESADTTDESTDQEPEDSDTNTAGGSSSNNSNVDEPAGLERYLTPSPADAALTNITNVINTSKERLDDYRTDRLDDINATVTGDVTVNEEGFGEIERLSEAETNKPEAEKPDGWLGTVFESIAKIASALYTVLLGALSFTLSHPVLIQILLLLLILYGLYRLAKKFGSRPN